MTAKRTTLLQDIAAKAYEMREMQKMYFSKRKLEQTPYATKETKLILKRSKELEAELDGMLEELVAETEI